MSRPIRAFLTPPASGRVGRALKTTQLILSVQTSKLPDVQRSSLRNQKVRVLVLASFFSLYVKGFRSAYQRFVGGVEAMTDKAAALNQQWLKGIGYARSLAANR